MMKISELGEVALIEHIAEALGPVGVAAADEPEVLISIGDDAAVWRPPESDQLVTTDTMVENVHFRLDIISWRDLGWKVIAINLSDIAAMGGIPRYAVVSMCLTADTDVESVAELYRGMADICGKYGCKVIGGDTVSGPALVLTVTLIGQASGGGPHPDNVLNRCSGRPGQKIAVTGNLGSSGAGLKLLLDASETEPALSKGLAGSHNRPVPRLAEGRFLLSKGVRAAMDLSDGLMADLPKLCSASGVSARINIDCIPIHPYVKSAFGDQALELALSGGEDYELLFAADEAVLEGVKRECTTPITVIGELLAGDPGEVTLVDGQGREVPRTKGGWEHFTSTGEPEDKKI